MKILHYYIITIFATSLVVVSNPVFADDSTSYGGFTGYRQAYFQGNHGSYPIWYKITNGTVVGTPLDLPAKALLFEINTTSNGQLTVELPRTIIDSKNGSDDVPYFVSVYDIKSLGGPMKISPEEIDDDGIRALKINFTKDITEIEIVGTFFVEKYHYAAPNSMSSLSPLKQYESGLAAKDVKCEQGLQLVIKAKDGSPACVKQDTVQKLIERGWGIIPLGGLPTYHNTSIFDTGIYPFSINVANTNFTLNYNISGNNKLIDANMYAQKTSLVLSMHTSSNGTLSVSIPRTLLDSNLYPDTRFIVLVDKKEVNFTETVSLTARTLVIPFEYGAETMEIIAPQRI